MKALHKFEAGDVVRVVHKLYGECKATVVSVLLGGLYLISVEGREVVVHEKFLSEM